MFHIIRSPPPVMPFGSCLLTLRSPLGTDLHLLAWLAADVSLLKEALMSLFHCPAEQISLLSTSLEPIPDRTWIRQIPLTGPTRFVYLAIMDTIVPKQVRIQVPVETRKIPTPKSLRSDWTPLSIESEDS